MGKREHRRKKLLQRIHRSDCTDRGSASRNVCNALRAVVGVNGYGRAYLSASLLSPYQSSVSLKLINTMLTKRQPLWRVRTRLLPNCPTFMQQRRQAPLPNACRRSKRRPLQRLAQPNRPLRHPVAHLSNWLMVWNILMYRLGVVLPRNQAVRFRSSTQDGYRKRARSLIAPMIARDSL